MKRRLRRWLKRLAQRGVYLTLGAIGWALARMKHGNPRLPSGPGGFRPRRILIIRLDFVGDLVLSTPAIRALRRAYADAELHLLALPTAAGVLAGDPDVDCVLTYDPHAWRRAGALLHGEVYRTALALLRTLRANHYDLCVSLCGDWASIWARLSGARRRVGYRAEGYPYFFTDAVPGGRMNLTAPADCLPLNLKHREHRDERSEGQSKLEAMVSGYASCLDGRPVGLQQHEVAAVLELARAAGATIEPADYIPRLYVDAVAAAEVAALLRSRGVTTADIVVVVHVGAANGTAKRWPVQHWAVLADRLIAETGVRVVLTGAADDRRLTRAVDIAMREQPVDLAGETTLPQLVALLARAQLVISGDSGPLHIAGAVGTPVVAIYGPTDPVKSGPIGSPAVVLRRELWCSPCYDPRETAECRYGNPVCMWGVRPDQVYMAAWYLLHRPDVVRR
jgi:ADP-heptose:LPS heptosyltransferase